MELDTFDYRRVMIFNQFKEKFKKILIDTVINVNRKYSIQRRMLHKIDEYPIKIFTRVWLYNCMEGNVDDFFPMENYQFPIEEIEYLFEIPEDKKEKFRYFLSNNDPTSKIRDLIRDLLSVKYSSEGSNYSFDFQKGFLRVMINGKIIRSIMTPKFQVETLKKRCKTDNTDAVALELLRMHSLGSLGEHFSIPPTILKVLNIDMELFGTPVNTVLPLFCSPFGKLDSYFGSQGSFFDYNLVSNRKYTFNPPYDSELMDRASLRILSQLGNTRNVHIICIIPVWDPKTQIELGETSYGVDFPAFDRLIGSEYFVDRTVLKKSNHPFYHYFQNKHVYATNTHVIILSNSLVTLPKLWTVGTIEREWTLFGKTSVDSSLSNFFD